MNEQEILRQLLVDLFLATPRKQEPQRDIPETDRHSTHTSAEEEKEQHEQA